MHLTLQALLNIISNPVNSTVPIAAETLKRLGAWMWLLWVAKVASQGRSLADLRLGNAALPLLQTTLPFCCLSSAGVYDEKRVLGVTTLDVVRALCCAVVACCAVCAACCVVLGHFVWVLRHMPALNPATLRRPSIGSQLTALQFQPMAQHLICCPYCAGARQDLLRREGRP